jgi:type I restriction enzyme S subunit
MNDWRRTPLHEVMSLAVDRVSVEPTRTYRVAGVYSFGRGLFRRDDLIGSATSYSYLHRLHSGHFVMSKLKAWEGAVAVVTDPFVGYTLSPEFPTYELDVAALLPGYLALLATTARFWDALASKSKGMGGRRERVHQLAVLEVEIDVPPLAEQRRIVDLIEAVDAGVRASDSVREHLVGLRESVADRLIWSDGFPLRTLKDVAVTKGLIGGPFGSSLVGSDYRPEGVPVIRGGNLSAGRYVGGDFAFVTVEKAAQLHRNLAQPGDVIATQRGTIGQVAIVPPDQFESYVVSQSQMRLRVDESQVLRDYVYLALSTNKARSVLDAQTIATANPHINLGIFAGSRIPVPPLDQQREIVDLVMSVENAEVALAAELVARRALRSVLLADLLSGAHVIPESYNELLTA